MAVFEGALLHDARTVIARYPGGRERSAVMPLLYLVQSAEGRVSRDGLREVAELLGITTAEVEAVATFYTMYRMRPTGEHLVNVCTNLACMLRGGKDVYEAAHEAAGMAHGQEISDDGMITLHEEECLGVCDFAPAVQIDFMNHDNVSPERMRELIAQLRAGEVPTPARGPKVDSFRHASRVLAGVEPAEEARA
jgi:NADH-quinone oxidoreductase subunit E